MPIATVPLIQRLSSDASQVWYADDDTAVKTWLGPRKSFVQLKEIEVLAGIARTVTASICIYGLQSWVCQ